MLSPGARPDKNWTRAPRKPVLDSGERFAFRSLVVVPASLALRAVCARMPGREALGTAMRLSLQQQPHEGVDRLHEGRRSQNGLVSSCVSASGGRRALRVFLLRRDLNRDCTR